MIMQVLRKDVQQSDGYSFGQEIQGDNTFYDGTTRR